MISSRRYGRQGAGMLVILVTVLMGILFVLGLASSRRSVDVSRRLRHAHLRSHGLDACRNAVEEAAAGFLRACSDASPLAPSLRVRGNVGHEGDWLAFSTGDDDVGEGDRKFERLRWALVNDPSSFRGSYLPSVARRAVNAPFGAVIEVESVEFACLALKKRGRSRGGTLSIRSQATVQRKKWTIHRSFELRLHFWILGTRVLLDEAPIGTFIDEDAIGGTP